MRKSVLYILFVLVLGTIAFAQTENMLISPSRLVKVPIGYGSYDVENFYAQFDNEEGVDIVDVNMIDIYPNKKVSLYFQNTFHIADYTGKPRFNFKSYENIYLKDRRNSFVSNEYRGYVYEPNSPVDIYVLFDLRFYEDEASRFNLLRSFTSESRTRSQLYLEKITVYTDENGKLPFTNLGKIGDLYNKIRNSPSSRVINREGQGFTSYALPGHHGTYDYSDTPGNRLSDDPFPSSKIYFDVFIDADSDGHFNTYGGHHYELGIGYVKDDGDHYLYPETPSFSIERNTIRSFKSCCICEENAVELFNLGDISDCKLYCAKAGQTTVSWNKGICEVEEGGTFLPFEDYVDESSSGSSVQQNVQEQDVLETVNQENVDVINEYTNEDAEEEIKEIEQMIKEEVNLKENDVNFDNSKIPVLIFIILIVIIASIAIAKGKNYN